MFSLKVGDIVTRRSYGGDLLFKIVDIKKDTLGSKSYILRGLSTRIEADADESDLLKQNSRRAYSSMQRDFSMMRNKLNNSIPALRAMISRTDKKPGSILHIDSAEDFLKQCLDYYKQNNIECNGKWVSESQQPGITEKYLKAYRPDILILTGHDGLKKDSKSIYSIESYANSRYFVESVRIARAYQPDPDKLCIFAGACQSYFEEIMRAGANFASSPKRVLINALDPAIVAKKVSLTENTVILKMQDVIPLTITGSDGIGGRDTKGQMK